MLFGRGDINIVHEVQTKKIMINFVPKKSWDVYDLGEGVCIYFNRLCLEYFRYVFYFIFYI